MSSQTIEELSDANFDADVVRSQGATVVQFWAPWSSACQIAAGSFKEVAAEYEDRVEAVRINVDVNSHTAANYGVTNLPSFVLFVDGKAVARIGGSASRERLHDLFEQA